MTFFLSGSYGIRPMADNASVRDVALPRYCIECLMGVADWKISDKIREISSVHEMTERSAAFPALQVFPSVRLNEGEDEAGLRRCIGESLQEVPYLSCMLNGWSRERSTDGHALGFAVRLSKHFCRWQADLAVRLATRGDPGHPDMKSDAARFIPALHPLALKEIVRIWRDLDGGAGAAERVVRFVYCRNQQRRRFIRPIHLPVDLLRVRIRSGDTVIAEYDMPSQAWLTQDEACDPDLWAESLHMYRLASGQEIAEPRYATENEIFVGSDLHLGHANIIRYCARPFADGDCREMDRVLMDNWNYTIRPGDRAFFLGDLSLNGKRAEVRNYANLLNGRITFIRGNHDTAMRNARASQTLVYDGIPFLLVHDPRDAPEDFRGWMIHGHVHNGSLKNHPFIDFEHRRVNICPELTCYCPVRLSTIASLIRKGTAAGAGGKYTLQGPF
jgi:calcineurin-like phosphoesterase family protein